MQMASNKTVFTEEEKCIKKIKFTIQFSIQKKKADDIRTQQAKMIGELK